MNGNIETIFANNMETEYANDNVAAVWGRATFGPMRLMQLTSRGRVGERSIAPICREIFGPDMVCHTSYTNPILVPEHWSFDALLQWADLVEPDPYGVSQLDPDDPESYIKLEVKTNTLDQSNRFQVNNVRLDEWDYLLLLGVTPDSLAFLILTQDEVRERTLTNMASTADGNFKLMIRYDETQDISELGDALADMVDSYRR